MFKIEKVILWVKSDRKRGLFMFKMWSAFHFVYSFALYFHGNLQIAFRKLDQEKAIAGLVLSVLAVVILLLRNGEIFVKSGYKLDPEIIPCKFAILPILSCCLPLEKSDVLFALAFCLNLPAAFISIIFAIPGKLYDPCFFPCPGLSLGTYVDCKYYPLGSVE